MLVSCLSQKPYHPSVPVYYENTSNVSDFPFQVIHSENAYIQNDREIGEKLGLIDANDTITLINGHLMMVHYLGEFFEFSGNKTIVISDLLYKSYGILTSKVKARLNIARLFDTNRIYNFTGAVIREPSPAIEFLMQNPEENILFVQKDKEICLRWKGAAGNTFSPDQEYQVVFKNIFDEVIHTETVSNFSFQLKKLDNEYASHLILYQVQALDEYGSGSLECAINFTEEPNYYYPATCDVSGSAIKSLETAFFLENSGSPGEAEKYYRQAAELSEYKIYEELLHTYLQRVGQPKN